MCRERLFSMSITKRYSNSREQRESESCRWIYLHTRLRLHSFCKGQPVHARITMRTSIERWPTASRTNAIPKQATWPVVHFVEFECTFTIVMEMTCLHPLLSLSFRFVSFQFSSLSLSLLLFPPLFYFFFFNTFTSSNWILQWSWSSRMFYNRQWNCWFSNWWFFRFLFSSSSSSSFSSSTVVSIFFPLGVRFVLYGSFRFWNLYNQIGLHFIGIQISVTTDKRTRKKKNGRKSTIELPYGNCNVSSVLANWDLFHPKIHFEWSYIFR